MSDKPVSRSGEDRVSLHGLDPEEALRALLAVRQDDKPAKTDAPAAEPQSEDQRQP